MKIAVELDAELERSTGAPRWGAGINDIAAAFGSVDRAGARNYARFVASSVADEPQLERRAVGAIARFVNFLPPATGEK